MSDQDGYYTCEVCGGRFDKSDMATSDICDQCMEGQDQDDSE